MNQVLGLRPVFNEQKQKWEKTDNTFFKRFWRFDGVPWLFKNIDEFIKQIPTEDRWDLYYTVAKCGDKKREFQEQTVVVFDIDGIDQQRLSDYRRIVCLCLGVDESATGIVSSGNGLHFIIGLTTPIQDPTYFERNRLHYKAICEKLKAALVKNSLPGEPDPAVFDHRRIMRLPGTENRKTGRPVTRCVLLQPNITPIDFDVTRASGLPRLEATEHIPAQALAKYPKPDTQAILQGCEFLKWCKEKPNEVSEAQWYGMLSILPRLPPNGRDISHDFSKGHRSYSHDETETKIDQALAASGPRTCGNINGLWGKCESCPNFGKVNSPIMIQGESYIKTQDSGFYNQYIGEGGTVKLGKPAYEDLRRYFEREHPYVILGESGICLTWNGKFWEEYPDLKLKNYAQSHFDPPATGKLRTEFAELVCCTNLKAAVWFTDTTNRKINFRNGVLNLDTLALSPHTQENGFRYVLNYDYDPSARAPKFEKFLREIMDNREDLIKILLEYVGYSFSNDECWAQKALILTGEGANGKSTFMDIIKKLAGKENYSTLTLSDLKGEATRKMLDGKLFNLAEETPTYAMAESSIFKNLVSGGETTVKVLYKQPYSIANKSKLLFACNELPKTKDTTRGFLRRLIIVPFERKFEGAARDPFIKEELLTELPGIFNLIIEGYRRLKEQRLFTGSSVVDEQLDEYHTDLDSVKAWYDNCIAPHMQDASHECFTTLTALYSSYSNYAETAGEKPEPMTTVGKRLKGFIPNYGARHSRKLIKNRKETVLKGVKLVDGNQY